MVCERIRASARVRAIVVPALGRGSVEFVFFFRFSFLRLYFVVLSVINSEDFVLKKGRMAVRPDFMHVIKQLYFIPYHNVMHAAFH